MRLGEFSARIDEIFDLERFAEPSGWDFALSKSELDDLLGRGSTQFRRTLNGLIAPEDRATETIRRVYLAVFPAADLLDLVISEEAREPTGAVVLTHHPVDMETSGRGFVPISPRQLDRLDELRVHLFVLHAPLDCHDQISTSRAIADGLGLTIAETFAPYVAGDCGVIGEQAPESFTRFAERVRALCELQAFQPNQVRFGGREVHRVAIVAGGGDDTSYLEQTRALGCDTYLAGHWWTPHPGEWCDQNRAAIRTALPGLDMNLLSASHDGSELVVFRDRLEPQMRSWGLETRLLRQADHWR